MNIIDGSTILVTGGTGSFGNAFVKSVLAKYSIDRLIIYSRDEFKQHAMSQKFYDFREKIRFFLGDVRDLKRLKRACEGVDYLVHAAALKQVPALEYNPTEAVQTNIMGSENVINAVADTGVKKAILISSDKAVNPTNLYGATKLVAERLFISANAYVGGKSTFSVVRYGNVVGSRGSVAPIFRNLKNEGRKVFPLTDERMTRFWITLEQSVNLSLSALVEGIGGEIFVPKIPSMRIVDLARAIDPEVSFDIIGIRPGEKLHETLISEDEARHTRIFKDMYVILPQFSETVSDFAEAAFVEKYNISVPDEFVFTSDKNDEWLTGSDFQEIL